MKLHSLKFKITLWYTSIILILFALVLGCTILASEYYSEDNMKEQLLDEVLDLKEISPQNISVFYDDGVMLSLYHEDGTFIDGIVPDTFPLDTTFSEDTYRQIHTDEDRFYIYESKLNTDREALWIRGIYAYSSTTLFLKYSLTISCFSLPFLIFFITIAGYHMIKRSLKPIYTISQTVDAIIASSDLSVRLEQPSVKDEFYHLTETFNMLLSHLQEQFLREQQFSSDAAHELRTPISSLLSRCEYCLEELEPEEELRCELSSIRQKTLEMSDLVSHLLTISRTEAKQYQPTYEKIDLTILAETILDASESKARDKQIALQLDDASEPLQIEADMEMMMRLFTNMIENAITYGREGGFVKVMLQRQGNMACIEFTDNGIGIPDDCLPRIWDRFYQVDSSRSSSGFGLGLYMVKQIVHSHGGTVTVQSVTNLGTSFRILLPFAPIPHTV